MGLIYKSLTRTLGIIAFTAGISLTSSAINHRIEEGGITLDQTKGSTTINVLEQRSNITVFELDIHSFSNMKVNTNRGSASIIDLKDGSKILEKGSPDLPKIATAIQIPDAQDMEIKVVDSEYTEYANIDIAPSKGNLSRSVNPSDIAYQYGETYQKDAFFPGKLIDQGTPYIIRNVRGQSPILYPFQYNPITKTLRVYTKLTIKAIPIRSATLNILDHRSRVEESTTFHDLYQTHFINYKKETSRYTPLSDTPGNMLIICYGAFMDEMEDFVQWKNQKGIPTELVNVSDIGGLNQIQAYVRNYYQTNGLSYLLLVGDSDQVPTHSYGIGGGETGYSDNKYGYIAGNDNYLDIFVGRFSAETAEQVTTQVDRTIHYEKNIQASETWMENAYCSASAEGGSNGDNNQTDVQHMNHIQNDLEGFGYNVRRVDERGGSVSKINNAINPGIGVANYVGHGYDYFWVNVRYDIDDVNGLTNENKLPFIMNVACVNGKFTDQTCFAESWLRATNNGNPTGAIAMIASTINQDWAPPMRAQDEFNDILTASYSNNIKKTFAGLAINGIFDMLDNYPSNGPKNAHTWTIFGDPSLMARSAQASSMELTHADNIPSNASTFTVNCNEDGALVGISKEGLLLGKGFVNNGIAQITLSNVPANGQAKITVTAFNKVTKVAEVSISGDSGTGGDPNPIPTTYCESNSENSTYEWISSVEIGDFIKKSQASHYTDFTSNVVDLAVGENVPIRLTQTYSGSEYTEYFRVWIDYNKDGDFDDANELVFSGNGKQAISGNIHVPENLEGTTRMRIGMSDASSQDPCDTFNYGEVEDYTVNFVENIVLPTVDYCECSSTNKSYEHIAEVKLGDFVKSSSNSFYSDYTDETIALISGESTQIELTPGFAGSAYNEYWSVWIDYNRDGDFDDAGEKVFSINSGSKHAVSGSFNVKDIQVNTRMRIAMKDGYIGNSCGTYTYGEVEDYTVQISGESRGVELNSNIFDVEVYPNPTQDLVRISGHAKLMNQVYVYDLNGIVIESLQFIGSTEISLSDKPDGMYLIRLINKTGQWTEKVVKR